MVTSRIIAYVYLKIFCGILCFNCVISDNVWSGCTAIIFTFLRVLNLTLLLLEHVKFSWWPLLSFPFFFGSKAGTPLSNQELFPKVTICYEL